MKKILFALLILVSAQAQAATAYWTGRMEQAQSVTYRIGWNCQYQYAGNYFWVFFTGSCPSSIQVQ